MISGIRSFKGRGGVRYGKHPVQSVGKMGVTTLGTIFTDMEKVTEHIAGVVDTQSPSDQWLSENGSEWVWEEEVATREKLTPEQIEQIKGYTGTDGYGMRGITDETYKAYGVRHKYSEEARQAGSRLLPRDRRVWCERVQSP